MIHLIRLTDGTDLIGAVSDKEYDLIITEPLELNFVENDHGEFSIDLNPYLLFTDVNKVRIHKEQVIYFIPANEHIVNAYNYSVEFKNKVLNDKINNAAKRLSNNVSNLLSGTMDPETLLLLESPSDQTH